MINDNVVLVRNSIEKWLQQYIGNLDFFRKPVAYTQIASSVGFSEDLVRKVISEPSNPVYVVFEHLFSGRKTPSKPFALYPCDEKHCMLDWEFSITEGLELWFKNRGYEARQELGSSNDIAALKRGESIATFPSISNQRDLWAHEVGADRKNLWIIEVKGKVAAEFDFYMITEGMAQIFLYPDHILQGLLGSRTVKVKGHIMSMVEELKQYWTINGKRIHIGLALPNFHPTPIWKGGKTVFSQDGFYARPLAAIERFLITGQTEAQTGQYKYQRFFGEMLDNIENRYGLRALMRNDNSVVFHVLAVSADYSTQKMLVTDFASEKPLQL